MKNIYVYKLFRHFQESPVNTGKLLEPRTFNFSLNFRRDSPVSSPYGYAVKLAPKSRKFGTVIDERIISGKSHPITWFVSNSKTESRRELLVDELKVIQNYYNRNSFLFEILLWLSVILLIVKLNFFDGHFP